MTAFNLQAFDERLGAGAASFSPRFAGAQIDFIRSRQMPDGGFAGRKGNSDLYYTDFAVRALLLLKTEDALLSRVVEHLRRLTSPPRDAIDCFNRLNLGRLVRSRGFDWTPDQPACRAALAVQQLPEGGWARPGQKVISAYHTFMAVLSKRMLGDNPTETGNPVEQLVRLKRRDGGYAEMPDQSASQTAATAAAVLVLNLESALPPKDEEDAAGFLKRMQAPDGGMLAHADAPASDLLTTFVALTALATLNALSRADRAGVARFVKGTGLPSGGFRGSPLDSTPDVEYTYYGIATLALLSRNF